MCKIPNTSFNLFFSQVSVMEQHRKTMAVIFLKTMAVVCYSSVHCHCPTCMLWSVCTMTCLMTCLSHLYKTKGGVSFLHFNFAQTIRSWRVNITTFVHVAKEVLPVVQETGRAVSCYEERFLKSCFPPSSRQMLGQEARPIANAFGVLHKNFFRNSF